ncbi:hypothetical protein BAR153v2_002150 [Bartonella sp. AR 15-3]|nr:hypothetical protein BAR153v2_002150 [Bartonella sp. AR 15-3]
MKIALHSMFKKIDRYLEVLIGEKINNGEFYFI